MENKEGAKQPYLYVGEKKEPQDEFLENVNIVYNKYYFPIEIFAVNHSDNDERRHWLTAATAQPC